MEKFEPKIKNINDFESRRNSGFVVCFPEEFEIPSWGVRWISNPVYTMIGKKGKWENIEINFIDFIVEPISDKLLKVINRLENIEKKMISNHLFKITIKFIDPVDYIVGTWEIGVKEIVSIDFGAFNYASNNVLREVKMIIAPGYICTLPEKK
jgi:hypothetical protein